MDYDLKVRMLAAYRQNISLLQGILSELVKAVTESDNYISLSEALDGFKKSASETEAAIREMAVADMNQYGTQPGHSAVKVIKSAEYTITDNEAAVQWCLDNLPSALTVDTKKLTKFMREFVADNKLPPFVKLERGFKATISTDLSAYYLENQDDTPII